MSLIHSIVNICLKAGKRVYDPPNPMNYPAARAREVVQNKNAKAPRSVKIKEGTMGGVPVEKLTTPQNPTDRIIFYIHGGGFVVGSVKTRRAFTGYVASKLGCKVLAAEYRLAPEAPFPAAPKDCFAVYQELLKKYAPNKVVILGESAGGNLVLATLLQIKEAGLPQPAAAVCIAPCVQFDERFPSYTENAQRDSIVANLSEEVFDMYLQSHDIVLAQNPLFAPYYGDFTGCPPIYLWASTAEILRDDSVMLYENLRQADHPCNLYLRDGMMHTWMIIPYFPEARKDLNRLKTHLEDAFLGRFRQEAGIVRL